ncbi:MAG: hypothetical protein ACI4F7_10180, partial [Acutalibacteraceae bacterium]
FYLPPNNNDNISLPEKQDFFKIFLYFIVFVRPPRGLSAKTGIKKRSKLIKALSVIHTGKLYRGKKGYINKKGSILNVGVL